MPPASTTSRPASKTEALFKTEHAIVGMVHVLALPGSPRASESISNITRRAVDEAKLLVDAGFDALILENMHDVPYLKNTSDPEVVASMTAIACAVRAAVKVPIGVQILAASNRAALAVALAANLQFVRAEGFVFASVADEGLMSEADAGPLLRYRRTIGAQHIAIMADIKKKHSSHVITADISIAESAAAAEFFGADAVVLTGGATGQPTALNDIDAARQGCQLPVVVGSGANATTIASLLARADAIIAGSDLKRGGSWRNEMDRDRVRAFTAAARAAR